MQQVANRTTFPEEFRITDDIKFDFLLVVPFDGLRNFFAGFDRHGGFIHDDFVLGHCTGHFPGHALDKRHVDRTIRFRRSRHSNENYLGVSYAIRNLSGKAQLAARDVFLHQLFKSWLVNRDAATLQERNFLEVVIHAHHLVADFGKTRTGN